MKPVIIIPNEEYKITLVTEDFKEYINNAYESGFQDGYEKGKNEKEPYYYMPTTYRDINEIKDDDLVKRLKNASTKVTLQNEI